MMGFFRKDDCARDFKIEGELGRGSFAVVKKATSRKDNSVWALKCIDKGKLEREDEEALRTEVAILERMDHPHIIKLKAVYDTPKTFYMVLEMATGGELFDRIVNKGKYSEKEAADVVRCLADALFYCHQRGVVHRDLKPENLLFADTTDSAAIKIADFGLAKLLNQNQLMATACGTPGYVAPEILLGRPYTDKVDLWSLGVITYILLCGFPPFYDENNAALFAQIKSGRYDFPSPYWDEIGDGAKDLVRHLLVVDPNGRYGATDVLKHPWVTGGARTTKLESAFTQLRRFNARRRFRAGVRKVMAAQAFARFGKFKLAAVASAAAANSSPATVASTAAAAAAAAAPAAPPAPAPVQAKAGAANPAADVDMT